MASRGTVGQLLVSMRAELGQLKTDVKEVERTFSAGFKTVENEAKKLSTSVDTAFKGLQRTIISTFSVGALVSFGKGILDASISIERITNTLKVVAGSGAGAAAEFGFVREEAKRLGLDLATTAGQYAQLAAASKGTALQGKQTRDIFIAVSEAATVLGLSADQAGGALKSIQQMISKGIVQAEELRGQLGERLPGAFQIAARAMGVTTQELGKLLESGKVIPEDLLPKIAAELKKTFGPGVAAAANSTQAQINRLTTAFLEFKVAIGNAGFITALTTSMQGLSLIFNQLGSVIDRARLALGFFNEAGAQTRIGEIDKELRTLRGTFADLDKGSFFLGNREDALRQNVEERKKLLQEKNKLELQIGQPKVGIESGLPAAQPVDTAGLKKAADQTQSFIASLAKQRDALRASSIELTQGALAAKAYGLDLEFAAFKARLAFEKVPLPANATSQFEKVKAELLELADAADKLKLSLEQSFSGKRFAEEEQEAAAATAHRTQAQNELNSATLEGLRIRGEIDPNLQAQLVRNLEATLAKEKEQAAFMSEVFGPAFDKAGADVESLTRFLEGLKNLGFKSADAPVIKVIPEFDRAKLNRDLGELDRLKLSLDVQAELGFDVDTLGGQIDLLKRQLQDLFKDFKTPEAALADPRVQELTGQIKTKTEAKTFADLKKELKLAGDQARVFGISFDGTGAAITATRNAIVELMASGLEPLNPKITELKIKLDDLSKNQELIEGFRNIANSITSAFDETLRGVLQGTQKFGEAMKNLFRNIMLSITNEILKLGVINPLKKALEEMLNSLVVPGSKGGSSSSGAGFGGILGGLLGGGGGSSFGFGSAPAGVQGPAMANGGFFSTALGGLMSFFGFEKGGPVPASGELKRFAKGGLVEVPRDLQHFARGGLVSTDGAIQRFARGGLVRPQGGTVYADSEVRRFAKGGLVEDGGIIKRFANGGFVAPARDLQRFAKGGLVEAARPGVVYSPESGRILSTIQRFAKGGFVEVDREIKRATRFATGGKVKGDADEVPAILHKGEFVLKKSIVEKLGVQFLQQVNAGKEVAREITSGGFGKMPAMKMDLPRFVAGGLVGAASMAFAPGSAMAMPAMSAGSVTNNYIDARGAQRGVTAEVQRAIEQGNAKTVKQSVAAMKDDRRRSNNTSKIFK